MFINGSNEPRHGSFEPRHYDIVKFCPARVFRITLRNPHIYSRSLFGNVSDSTSLRKLRTGIKIKPYPKTHHSLSVLALN
jgi:hypothetical protein